MQVCGAYARHSDADQRPTSIEDQVRRCAEVAAREGLKLDDRYVFSDAAITGKAEGKAKRKGYLRLIDAVDAREFEVLLVDEISRLTRHVTEGGLWMDRVEQTGLRIISADGVDTAQGGWRQLWMLKLMVAATEIESTGHRTTRGMVGQLERGYQIAQPPYGYRPVREMTDGGRDLGTRWVVHEPEAQLVREMYRWRHDGHSAAGIARRLQDRGVAPPGRARKNAAPYWRAASVYRLLANTVYRGQFVWNGSSFTKAKARKRRKTVDERLFERPELRLVSDEVWHACNAKSGVQRPRSPRGGGKHLFSGLARCGDCDSLLSVGSGNVQRSYYCAQCEMARRVGARETWLGYTSVAAARVVLNWVLQKILAGSVLEELHRRLRARVEQGPEEEEREARKRIALAEARASRLHALMTNPDLDANRYIPDMQATERELRIARQMQKQAQAGRAHLNPEVLEQQLSVRPAELLSQLLESPTETYKVRATLRRLLRRFVYLGRPQTGASRFLVELQPGVCLAELSSTDVIDESTICFEVVASTTARRPVTWTVTGTRQ